MLDTIGLGPRESLQFHVVGMYTFYLNYMHPSAEQ